MKVGRRQVPAVPDGVDMPVAVRTERRGSGIQDGHILPPTEGGRVGLIHGMV